MAPKIENDTSKSANPSTSQTLGAVASRGMMWLSLSIGVGRLAALGSAWVIGWLLTKSDFSVYGLAVAIWAMTGVLRDGGAGLVLVQRGDEFPKLAQPVFMIALIFNSVAALLLIILAKPASLFFESPDLDTLMIIGAIGVIFYSPVAVLRAKLSIDLRFKEISRINAQAAIARHLSIVIYALLLPEGHRVLCFGLTLPTAALFEAIICFRAVEWRPRFGGLDWKTFLLIFKDARWIMLGALAIAIVGQGDKLVSGKLLSKEIFAVYFFGWQLTGAIAAPLTSSLTAVLMPTLSKMNEDRERQAFAYVKAIRLLTFSTAVLCVGAAVASAPGVRMLWQGKWDESIIVVQLLSLSLVAKVLSPLGRSLVEAQGRWKLRGAMLVSNASGTVIAGVIGALTGNLVGLVVTVMAYRVIIGVVLCAVGGAVVGVSTSRIMKSICPPIFALIPAGVVASYGASWLVGEQVPYVELLVCVAFYGLLVALLCSTVLRGRTMEAIKILRNRGA